MAKPLARKTKLFYGLGAFGYGTTTQTFSSFLMFFGTGLLGIPGSLMGIAIALSTVWDATTDPFVGYYSDKIKSKRFGKRHGFILFGCIAVAITNVLIWSISPDMGLWAKFSLLFVLLLVIETFNTTYSTPYQALGLDLSKTYEDRTAIQGYKTTFSFLALVVPSVLMSVFLSDARATNSSNGFIQIAIVTSILCVVCGLLMFWGTYKHRHQSEVESDTLQPVKTLTPNAKKKTTIHGDFFSVMRQKNVGRLILGYAISLSAGAFLTSLGMHIFTYTFHFSTLQIPFIMIALITGIIAGQPLWFYIAKRTDKIVALKSSLFIIILGMIIFGFVLAFRNSVPSAAVLPLVILTILFCGIGTGCLYSLPISMFADCIELERKRTGQDKTAISAAFLTFCTKISNAFILFTIGVSLDIIGFRGNQTTQSMSVQNWLGWLLIGGVTISAAIAIIIYSGYSYTKKDFEKLSLE
ncbi:MAG: MFS transporter [Firmicutes bacterium]|nr:MFS transporter [Bacillota bacterium]